MNTYFETSAILKLVVVEQGSDDAVAIWDGSDLIVTSRLSYPEAWAALAAARRARRLSVRQLGAAKSALYERFEEIELVEVTEELARHAGDLAEERSLRGYDAVHLASALVVGADGIVVATWDRELAVAARAEGLDLAGIRVD